LDLWRSANDAQLRADAERAVADRLAECRDTVGRLSGYPYDEVAALQRQIDEVQR
jgi:hypothetical protein